MVLTSDKFYVVKTDSVLVSDLLFYIWNKLKSTPVKTVINACLEFYKDNDFIYDEKVKLFN